MSPRTALMVAAAPALMLLAWSAHWAITTDDGPLFQIGAWTFAAAGVWAGATAEVREHWAPWGDVAVAAVVGVLFGAWALVLSLSSPADPPPRGIVAFCAAGFGAFTVAAAVWARRPAERTGP